MANHEVNIKDKTLLTLYEAAALTGIGIHKLRKMTNRKDCDFVLWNGTRRMLKRERLLMYLNDTREI